MIVSVGDILPKNKCFLLIDEKLYQHPGLFNTNDTLQTYQLDLSQMCNINILVEEQEEKIDEFEKTARNAERLIGCITLFTFFFIRDLLQSAVLFLLCFLSLYVLRKRPENYPKSQKNVLELCFNDQTKVSIEVDRDERESLYSILEKNKNYKNQDVKIAVYLEYLTADQKDTARARYWQIPAAILFFYALGMKVMLSCTEFMYKISEMDTTRIVPAIGKMSNVVLSILSYSPAAGFVLIICTCLRGEWRRRKLNKHDEVAKFKVEDTVLLVNP